MRRTRSVVLLAVLVLALTGCGQSDNKAFQGYIEGEYLYLASSREGRLIQLPVERGQSVAAGALLFELESEHERRALRQAEQELVSAAALLDDMGSGKRPEEIAMAQAQLNKAKTQAANAADLLRRHQALVKIGGISAQALDDSRAAARIAADQVKELESQLALYRLPQRKKQIEAQQAAAKAAAEGVKQARWELKQKRIQAPADGLVFATLFRKGEWVSAGSPVVQMLPPGNVKIRFFVPEPLIGSLRLGSRVSAQVDGLADPFSATISYVSASAEYTPPIIYSNESRSKLVFMAEALPSVDTAALLHPGQPVTVSLP